MRLDKHDDATRRFRLKNKPLTPCQAKLDIDCYK